jgi:putative ABC transport system permease protein
MILLIACANLANLLLARGAQRQREMAVRAALGAARSRMVRQLVSEAMLVAIFGGLGGVTLAYWTLPALLHLAPSTFDVVSVPVLDGRVLMFGLLVTLMTGTLFGAAPAFQLSGINVASALGTGGRGAVQKIAHEKVRSAFVVCQVAMSIVLLTAAGLLVRSFHKLVATNSGMVTHDVLTMEYRLPRNKYTGPESQAAFHRALASRVSGVPGVVSSAIVRGLPLSGNWSQIQFLLLDAPVPEKGHEPSSIDNYVTPGYFATVGIPLLRGRSFDDHDDASAPPVAVVSRAFAAHFWPSQDPLGRVLQLVDSDPIVDGRRVTIIGVVGDAKQLSLRDTDEAEIYFPYAQESGIFGTLVVRTAVEPMSLAEPVRRAVWSLDKDQPVWKIRTLQILVERDVEADRLLMVLMSGFGMLAMILSALGTYGILSSAVSQRQQEIGVRMALGAEPGAVRKLVMRQGTRLAGIGVLIGIFVALGTSRLMTGVLYGVSALDIWSFVASLAIMMLVAVAASYVPARRATKVDPMSALRYE